MTTWHNIVDIFEGHILVGESFWRVAAKLELSKRQILDAEWIIEVPDYIATADIFDIAMSQNWPRQHET